MYYCYIILTSCFIYTHHANIMLYLHTSIFMECCFYQKRFEWSKSLVLRFPPPNKKSPPAKFLIPPTKEGYPYLLMLFGKPPY